MDISRRRAFGLFAGAAGGVGLASCATTDAALGADAGIASLASTDVAVSFDHGVASGDALQDRVILWSRVTPASHVSAPIPVRLIVATDKSALEASELSDDAVTVMDLETSQSRDYTIKVDLGEEAPLTPDTSYYFQFVVQTPDGLVSSPIGQTRTLPKTGGDKLVMAVVSCSNYPFGYFNAYRAIAERDDVDAVMHLGDYIYEYGIDGYGGENAERLGRRVDPVTEIVSLEDYRLRHALYKKDPDLQAAHQNVPWYCTWDDHESTNNSYRTGAENHNPDNGEGDWTARKQRAVQAYLEWMPVRDPKPGRAQEAIYRSAQFGDLASMFMLESRLLGRSDEISWTTELSGVEPANIPAKVAETSQKVADPSRTMLGKVQEDWLAKKLKASVEANTTWQVLVNQVIMASVRLPDFSKTLKPEQLSALPAGYAQMLIPFSAMGLPFNLDAWDGFPAARERLFAASEAAGARLVTITGDTHTAWANEMHDASGKSTGVEFGCTSITSPGMGKYLPIEGLGEMFAEANEDVVWHDPFGNGFTLLTLTKDKAKADFYKVSTIEAKEYTTELVASFEATPEDKGVSKLKAV